MYSVIAICLLALVALLLLGSIGAFFLCFPVLPIALVAVILLGMVLLFLLGSWVGATRVLQSRMNHEGIQQRLRPCSDHASKRQLAATEETDECPKSPTAAR